MGSAQLAKLEGLSEQRADKSREAVERQREQLAQLEQHQNELKAISREYQTAPVGGVTFNAKLLAHRRAFVTKLTEQLDALDVHKEDQKLVLAQKVEQHRERSAQSAAIGAVYKEQLQDEQVLSAKREQLQQDTAYRSIEHSINADIEGIGDE